MTPRAPKPRRPAKVRVTGSCYMFATFDIVCPLCGTRVPANTEHSCDKKEPTR